MVKNIHLHYGMPGTVELKVYVTRKEFSESYLLTCYVKGKDKTMLLDSNSY